VVAAAAAVVVVVAVATMERLLRSPCKTSARPGPSFSQHGRSARTGCRRGSGQLAFPSPPCHQRTQTAEQFLPRAAHVHSHSHRQARQEKAHKVEDGGSWWKEQQQNNNNNNNKPARASSLLQRDVEITRKLLRSNATLTSDGILQQQQQHHEALQRELKAREQQLKELQKFDPEERAGGARAAAAAGAGAGRGDAQGGGRGEACRAVRCSIFVWYCACE
jgi:hypothetical protein